MADTEKHANCRHVELGLCLCGTCKNDHGQDGDKPPCCIKYYGIGKCPVVKCSHYEKEDAGKMVAQAVGKDVEQ